MSARTIPLSLKSLLPRVVVFLVLATAPVLALGQDFSGGGSFVGSEMEMSSGAGLVLVVSLQRAQ